MNYFLMSHGAPLKLNSNLISEKEFLYIVVYIQYRTALCFKSIKVGVKVIEKRLSKAVSNVLISIREHTVCVPSSLKSKFIQFVNVNLICHRRIFLH